MERKIISEMSKYLHHKDTYFDDVFSFGNIVFSIDTFVESTDKPKKLSYEDVGWKSVVAAISDLVCKGVRPIGINFSFVFPRAFYRDYHLKIAKGIREACDHYGLIIGKGDTNEGRELTITICAWGVTLYEIPKRGNIFAGDKVIALGIFGYHALGYKVLNDELKVEDQSILEKSTRLYRRPIVPMRDAILIISKGYVRAAIDSSDGLAISLYDLISYSDVDIIVENIPADETLVSELSKLKENTEEYIFYGGEEYIPIFAIRGDAWNDFMKFADNYSINYVYIGDVREGKGLVKFKNGRVLEKRGWDPFAL